MSDACCETSCCEPISTSTPGAQGPAGAAGADGVDGANSFTFVATYDPPPQPGMPAEGADVDVEYTTSVEAFSVGGIVYQQNWGWMRVAAIVDNITLTLTNIENTAGGLYLENAAPGAVLAGGSRLVPGGLQGPPGTPAVSPAPPSATYITQVPNATLTNEQALSILATGILRSTTVTGVLSIDALITAIAALAPTVADRLIYTTGVNTVAVATLTPTARTLLDDALTSDMRTTLGVRIGTDIQAFSALLLNIAGLTPTVADRYVYTTGVDTVAVGTINSVGRAFIGQTTLQLMNKFLGGQIPRYGRFCMLVTIDVNSVADVALVVDEYVSNARYRIDKIMLENASISLTTAQVGVFTAAGGLGTTIAAAQAVAGLTAANKWIALTLEAIVGTDVLTASPLYFRVTTAQGAAATVNVHLFGWSFDVT